MRRYFILICLVVLCLSACTQRNELENFTYKFSMESPANFKAEFQLNTDSTYKVSLINFFFDNFERTKKPEYKDGKLTKEEYDTFKNLLLGSKLETMKDSYGFDNPTKEQNIVYIIEFHHSGKTKYVSVNGNTNHDFPKDFLQLIEYTAQFINRE